MPLSRTRDYLSIGEVLDTVREEFPDISISKIRFLESEGLIQPSRTDSGYRMFYDQDVSRLRFILQLQRDHFLPLRVIRERLAEYDSNGGMMPVPAPKPAQQEATPKAALKDLQGASLTKAELAKTSGLTDTQLSELEDYGLIAAGESGSYDENALLVAKAAKRFYEYGVQARHLKMYRQIADREAAFFEQIISPVEMRKDPTGRAEATRNLGELASLGQQMKDAALRSSLRQLM